MALANSGLDTWKIDTMFHSSASVEHEFCCTLNAIDSDNGSEFLNTQVCDWCRSEQIAFTRLRSYHKNENPFVEQKNCQYVRLCRLRQKKDFWYSKRAMIL